MKELLVGFIAVGLIYTIFHFVILLKIVMGICLVLAALMWIAWIGAFILDPSIDGDQIV